MFAKTGLLVSHAKSGIIRIWAACDYASIYKLSLDQHQNDLQQNQYHFFLPKKECLVVTKEDIHVNLQNFI